LFSDDRLYEVGVPSGEQRELFSAQNLVGVTPDGMLIAVKAEDGSRIEIRERSTGKVRTTLAARKRLREVLYFSGDAAFSDDGRLFAAEDTESVRIWDLTSGQAPLVIPERGDRLVFSPNGALLLIAGSSWLRLWDTKTGELRQTMEDRVSAFAFRPDGKLLVTAHEGGTIRVWQAK